MTMLNRIVMIAAAIAAGGLAFDEARAQAAAEEAVVLSGTSSGTGSASRRLGGAVRGGIDGATRRIRTTGRAAPRGGPRRARRSGVTVAGPLAADSDPLENTDAPAYQLSNGATIRVSGGMRNSSAARCKLNCPKDKQASEAEPTELDPEDATESDAKTEEAASRPENETDN